ncbi:MAG: 1-acyl-sn-glycerol-3-phosphate acyltransferase [Muribaculaceae bacterium]|nr:1-acyl-sn-glycerol-3-phosphate acyltransferase [Muribaculaceae bacterium]
MNLASRILSAFGWKVSVTVPDCPKCIICVAPHTSNWDFIWGKLAYASVGRSAGFLMKESWFFWPLGPILRAMGGVPVPRRRGSSLSELLVERFHSESRLCLAITPEGTRSRTTRWRTGFLHIAYEAGIPIMLGAIDYTRKLILIEDEFIPTGDIDADMRSIKNFYRPFKGKYPEKFSTDDED